MNINELRAEVRKRQQAAQRKVARLRRNGVEVAGTVFDVRRDPSLISRYNSRQLTSYLSQLNAFVDRRNAFVGGVEGAPLRRSSWNAYKKAEKAYQSLVDAHYEQVKGIFIPEHGVTVEKFDKKMRRKRERGSGGVPRPYEQFSTMEAFQVMSEEKLQRLTENLNKRSDKGYLPDQIKRQRYQMAEAVKAYGDPFLDQLVKDLTDDQVDTLWNYTDAPRDLFSGYHFMKLLTAGKADEAQANIHEDDSYEAEKWLTWAYNLTPRSNGTNRK